MSQRLATFLHDRHPESPSNVLQILQERTAEKGAALETADIESIAQELELPIAMLHGALTFYEDLSPRERGKYVFQCCNGTACMVDGAAEAERDLRRELGLEESDVSADGKFSIEHVYCLGRCHAAPSTMVVSEQRTRHVIDRVTTQDLPRIIKNVEAGEFEGIPQDVTVKAFSDPVILLKRIDDGATAADWVTARKGGAYDGLEKALQMKPSEVIEEVKSSGLRGRGGAGFPTGLKWSFAAGNDASQKYVCCNADEGDPGAYIDKLLMERDPHGLLEGMAIAGYAIGATKGIIYLRSEYPEAIAVLEQAIEDAKANNYLGSNILNFGVDFDVELFLGSGSYVCGEETAMLRSIEGLRGEVSVRPPFPAEKGLYGKPTIVNNVETLANIGWILGNGGAKYAEHGVGKSRGTKLVCLNSVFKNPGLYEVPLGVTIQYVTQHLGGGAREGLGIKGVQIGGPMGGILPPRLFETQLGFEELAEVGALLGHGSILGITWDDNMRDVARHLLEFTADESCGKCVPCRIGSVRGVEMLDRVARGTVDSATTRGDLAELNETMELGSLCALGGGVPAAIRSILEHWPDEIAARDGQ